MGIPVPNKELGRFCGFEMEKRSCHMQKITTAPAGISSTTPPQALALSPPGLLFGLWLIR
jgi:hypothetical protein